MPVGRQEGRKAKVSEEEGRPDGGSKRRCATRWPPGTEESQLPWKETKASLRQEGPPGGPSSKPPFQKSRSMGAMWAGKENSGGVTCEASRHISSVQPRPGVAHMVPGGVFAEGSSPCGQQYGYPKKAPGSSTRTSSSAGLCSWMSPPRSPRARSSSPLGHAHSFPARSKSIASAFLSPDAHSSPVSHPSPPAGSAGGPTWKALI